MTIYNTSCHNFQSTETEAPIFTKGKKNLHWRMELFHPTGFFTENKNPLGIYGLLVHNRGKFLWVSPSVKFQRGTKEDGSTKWVPYNYNSLLTFYAPFLLCCFWDEEAESIIQIDKQLLSKGEFHYRHMNVSEFNSYVFDQHLRQFIRLKTSGQYGEVMGELFNPQWMYGDDIFPVSCSRQEVKQWMPHFHQTEEGFHIPEIRWEDQSPKDITRRWVPKPYFSTYAFKTKQDMPLIIDTFENLVGTKLTVEELHEVLDMCAYRKEVKKGRITTAIRLLRQEGIDLSRKSKKINGKVVWIYSVNKINVELVDSQPIPIR